MWKSACVGVYHLLNWKMHGETLKFKWIFTNWGGGHGLNWSGSG